MAGNSSILALLQGLAEAFNAHDIERIMQSSPRLHFGHAERARSSWTMVFGNQAGKNGNSVPIRNHARRRLQ